MECKIKFYGQPRYLSERQDRCTYNPETKELSVISYGGAEILFYHAEPDGKDFTIYEDRSMVYSSSQFGFFGHYTGNVIDTGDIIYAPFTPEQVRNLNVYQRSGVFHPFTCGNRKDHPWEEIDKGCLVATTHGWICPICWDGTTSDLQNWAHSFMAKHESRAAIEKAHGYRTVEKKEPINKKLEWLHTFCSNNREALKNIGSGCCFYCKEFFSFAEIEEWVENENTTALCPKCNWVDAVLPARIKHCIGDEMEEYVVTMEDLEEMRRYWF